MFKNKFKMTSPLTAKVVGDVGHDTNMMADLRNAEDDIICS